MITTWEEHKKQLLKDPEFRRALKETELEYEIARALIAARLKRGMTQQQLALKLKTKQSVISRAEGATTLPSLTFLRRLATALKLSVRVELV